MIQEQVIPIDFGQGLDTKTDPKLVVPGKMLRLENAVFTNVKRITKRNGYVALNNTVAGLGTLASPKMVQSYGSELIAADQERLLSYSTSQTAWINRGDYISTELTKLSVDQYTPASGMVDNAILGNYTLYGYTSAYRFGSQPFGPVFINTYGSVVDMTTGSIVCGPFILANSTDTGMLEQEIRCVVLGGSVLAVAYLIIDGGSGSLAVAMRLVQFAGSGVVTFGTELLLSTALTASVRGSGIVNMPFDIVGTATGATLIYKTNAGVTTSLINTAGAVTSSATIADVSVLNVMNVTVNTDGNLWVYYLHTAGLFPAIETLKYAIYSSTLSVVLAPTTIYVTDTTVHVIMNMTVMNVTTTNQRIFFSQITQMGSGKTDVSKTSLVTSAGVVTADPPIYAYGVLPISKSFTDPLTLKTYAIFAYRGAAINARTTQVQQQPTYFVLRLDPLGPITGLPVVAARFGSGLANNNAVLNGSYVSGVSYISGSKFLYTCAIANQEFITDVYELAGIGPETLSGSYAYQIDFDGTNSYKSINSSNINVLNGGLLQMYDGSSCTELGFHMFPEFTLAQSAGSGAIANGTYSYIAIFQWTDAQGNLHQSAPSEAVTITTTGSNNTVTATITTAYLSNKNGVSVALYRTKNAGTTYFLITEPAFVSFASAASPTPAVSVDIVDLLIDADLNGNPQPYTFPGSAVLENSTSPPSMITVSHNNRLWFVDSENPNTIWYTKSSQDLVGISPSAFLTEQVDHKFGNITALAEMDEKLIILKSNGLFAQSGDGATDTGSGSTLSFPQFIPSDVGCSYLKSVVLTPAGVMFQSPKGIYQLGRSLNVVYVGMEVQNFNSQIITSALLTPGKSQIRFLVNSGTTIVYDYIFNQWSTFTNHTGRSAAEWQSTYVYATTAGAVFQESSSSYTDNGTGYAVLGQTSWLALATVQGFQRVRRLIVLGDYANGTSNATHGLQIQASYDFDTSFSTALTYTYGASSTSGTFQYRERLPRQKCDTISLLIQEINFSNTAAYLDLSDISFEAGVKKGVNKMSQNQTVG